MRDDYPLDTAHYADMIAAREGDFLSPVQGVRMLSYLDGDGDLCWAYRVDGMARMVPMLGLIELVKLKLFEDAISEPEEG